MSQPSVERISSHLFRHMFKHQTTLSNIPEGGGRRRWQTKFLPHARRGGGNTPSDPSVMFNTGATSTGACRFSPACCAVCLTLCRMHRPSCVVYIWPIVSCVSGPFSSAYWAYSAVYCALLCRSSQHYHNGRDRSEDRM